VLLTRSPLTTPPKQGSPFDLHVLSTPPAFVLSQDQTLQTKPDPKKPTQQKVGKLKETHKGNLHKALLASIGTLLSSQTTHAHPSDARSTDAIKGLVSRRFFLLFSRADHRAIRARSQLGQPVHSIRSASRCQVARPEGRLASNSVSEARLRVVRARVATPGGSDAVLGLGRKLGHRQRPSQIGWSAACEGHRISTRRPSDAPFRCLESARHRLGNIRERRQSTCRGMLARRTGAGRTP
jgi:hypothetical protein